MEYPWYKKLNQDDFSLEQGDFIPDCPIMIPPEEIIVGQIPEIEIENYDVIILSQSCDLENGKVDIVLVCPYLTFEDFLDQQPSDRKTKKGLRKLFENLRQGVQPNYHLLNKDESHDLPDYLVLDFRSVFGVHINFLTDYVKQINPRVRLLSPYKEHLSQAFARFFMRVGLPQNIPPRD